MLHDALETAHDIVDGFEAVADADSAEPLRYLRAALLHGLLCSAQAPLSSLQAEIERDFRAELPKYRAVTNCTTEFSPKIHLLHHGLRRMEGAVLRYIR
jgi:hypothetical protein